MKFGLYRSEEGAAGKAQAAMSQSAQTLSTMQKEQYQPQKTIGGGLMAGVAGGLSGSTLGPWGIAGGAAVGLASYYLS